MRLTMSKRTWVSGLVPLVAIALLAVSLASCLSNKTAPVTILNSTSDPVQVLVAPAPYQYAMGIPSTHDRVFVVTLEPGESWSSTRASIAEDFRVRLIGGSTVLMARQLPSSDNATGEGHTGAWAEWTLGHSSPRSTSIAVEVVVSSRDGEHSQIRVRDNTGLEPELRRLASRSSYGSEISRLRSWRDRNLSSVSETPAALGPRWAKPSGG